MPAFLGVIDTVAGVVLAVGAAYFVFQLLVIAKQRLLWRVRRKLILSYIFIGFVPAMLIVAFFLLSGYLLFFNFSSYLVQSRLRAVGDEAKFIAQSAALEIQRAGGRDAAAVIARRRAPSADEFPGACRLLLSQRNAPAPNRRRVPRRARYKPLALCRPLVPGRMSNRRDPCRLG